MVISVCLRSTAALLPQHTSPIVQSQSQFITRRHTLLAVALASATWRPSRVFAAKDCFLDCEQNCNRLAPRSGRYCEQSCGEYCAQDDRKDGLSGSISSEKAEVGLLSAYDLKAKITGEAPAGVVYGQDKPPALPDVLGVGPSLRAAVTGGKRPDGQGRWSVESQGGVSTPR